jgi:hypothetical protein
LKTLGPQLRVAEPEAATGADEFSHEDGPRDLKSENPENNERGFHPIFSSGYINVTAQTTNP